MNQEIIKFSQVKTMDRLDIVSDRWYNRAEYLKSIFYDTSKPAEVREKAFKAWHPYFSLLTNLASVYHRALITPTNNFKKGGIVIGEVHKNERLINRK